MSYYILGISREEYRKSINRQIGICIAVLLSALLLNLLFCLLRTDESHTLFLILNILADGIGFSVIFFLAGTQILPAEKLYALALREKDGVALEGVIRNISGTPETVCGLECLEVTLEEEVIRKVFVVREGEFPCGEGQAVRLTVVDNLVVRAQVRK